MTNTNRTPATLTDIYPTLCELAGLPIPAQCTGTSLVPILKAPAKKTDRLFLTSYDFPNAGLGHAISDPRYRYIRYHDGFEELYDLQLDPNEFINIAAIPESATIKARLSKDLPKSPAVSVGIPKNSIYNGKPRQAPYKKR